jgi:hypothetical protein
MGSFTRYNEDRTFGGGSLITTFADLSVSNRIAANLLVLCLISY